MGSNPSPALCSWVSKDESLHLSEPPFRHLQNEEKNHVHPPLHCHEDGRDPGKWEQTLKRCPGNRKNTLLSSVSFFLRLQVAEADAPLTAEVAKSGKFQTAYVLLGKKKTQTGAFLPKSVEQSLLGAAFRTFGSLSLKPLWVLACSRLVLSVKPASAERGALSAAGAAARGPHFAGVQSGMGAPGHHRHQFRYCPRVPFPDASLPGGGDSQDAKGPRCAEA